MKWLIGGLALALVACVGGDDTSDASAPGALGGPCFANNTCNAGLVCVLENGKGICEQGDATTQDAPADTTASDAPGDVATSDASDSSTGDASDGGCTVQITMPCANQQCHSMSKGCCEKLGVCGATSADCNGSPLFDCSSNNDCSGNFPCCITAQMNTQSCPFAAQQTGLQVTCSTNTICPTGANQLCVSSNDCPTTTPTCKPFTIEGNVYGVCM